MTARVPLVLQAAPADCGPACAAMVLSSRRGGPLSVDEIDRLSLQASRDGMSVSALRGVLGGGGVEARALRVTDGSALKDLPVPQILFWDANHFVVAEGYTASYVKIADPAIGRRRVDWAEFADHFTSVAIVPTQTPQRRLGSGRRARGRLKIGYMLGLSDPRQLGRLLGIGLVTMSLDVLALGVVFLLRTLLADVGVTPVTTLTAALGALAVIEVTGLALRGMLVARMQTATETRLHTELFERLLRLDWSFFTRRSKGDLLSRLEFVRELYSKLFHDCVLVAFGIGTSLVALVALWIVDPAAAGVVLFVGVLCLALSKLIRERFVSVATSAVEARVRVSSFADEVLQGLEGLKGVRAEGAVGEMWRSRRARLAAVSRIDRLQVNALDAIQSAVIRTTQVVAVAAAALTASRTASAGDLVAALSLSGMALTPVLLAVRNYVGWGELESYVARYNDLLDRAAAPAPPIARPGFQRLSVEGMSFAFGGGRTVIEDLSFEIGRGEHVGLWAPSGAGKTTLLRLISGALKPTRGAVLVDGRPLDEAVADGFFCGIVPQEVALFAGTIAENLRVAAPDATDEELLAACAVAGLSADMARMPNGLETRLGVNGTGISGGQRQRIAIARAILSRPDVLLLDEATAALDSPTEAGVIGGLRDMTLIVVSHREDLMEKMDRVISLSRNVPGSGPDDGGRRLDVPA